MLYDPRLADSVVRRSAQEQKIMAGRSESLRERRAMAAVVPDTEESLDRVREQNLEWADKIDAQFKAANAPLEGLRHPDKPGLRAVSALPLIMDADRTGDEHVWVHFDSNPAEDLPPVAGQQGAAFDAARADQVCTRLALSCACAALTLSVSLFLSLLLRACCTCLRARRSRRRARCSLPCRTVR